MNKDALRAAGRFRFLQLIHTHHSCILDSQLKITSLAGGPNWGPNSKKFAQTAVAESPPVPCLEKTGPKEELHRGCKISFLMQAIQAGMIEMETMKNSILQFGAIRSVIFVLAVLIIAWMMLVSVISILAGTLYDKLIADPQIQAAGTLIATILLLVGVYRVGWINRIGIVSFVTLSSWMITLIVAIYVLLVNFYTQAARRLMRQSLGCFKNSTNK